MMSKNNYTQYNTNTTQIDSKLCFKIFNLDGIATNKSKWVTIDYALNFGRYEIKKRIKWKTKGFN